MLGDGFGGFQTWRLLHLQQEVGYPCLVERRNDQGVAKGVGLAEFLQNEYHTLGVYSPNLSQESAAWLVEGVELGGTRSSEEIVLGHGHYRIAVAYQVVEVTRTAAQIVTRHLTPQILDEIQKAWLIEHGSDEKDLWPLQLRWNGFECLQQIVPQMVEFFAGHGLARIKNGEKNAENSGGCAAGAVSGQEVVSRCRGRYWSTDPRPR